MTVSYDPALGYPTGINIKWSEFGSDGVGIISISNFSFVTD